MPYWLYVWHAFIWCSFGQKSLCKPVISCFSFTVVVFSLNVSKYTEKHAVRFLKQTYTLINAQTTYQTGLFDMWLVKAYFHNISQLFISCLFRKLLKSMRLRSYVVVLCSCCCCCCFCCRCYCLTLKILQLTFIESDFDRLG